MSQRTRTKRRLQRRYITFFTPFFHIHTTNITHIDTYIFNSVQFFSFLFFFLFVSGSVCRLFVIEDSPDLTSPPLPAANKQRSSSNSSRGTGTVNSRSTTALSLPPPQQQQPQQPTSNPSSSSAGYAPYHPEQAAAYQQYLQNQNAGAGGYRS